MRIIDKDSDGLILEHDNKKYRRCEITPTFILWDCINTVYTISNSILEIEYKNMLREEKIKRILND